MAYEVNKRGLRWNVSLVSLPRKTLLALLVIITMTQVIGHGSAASWVGVLSNLGDNQVLRMECHDNHGQDFPTTFVQPGEQVGFDFNGWGERWKCEFLWINNYQKFVVWDHEIYSPMPVKCGQCLWSARPDGWWVWDKSINDWKFCWGWTVFV